MKHQPINGWTRDLMIQAIWQGNNGTKSRATKAPSTCQYRGMNGNKCAIGVFIPDDVYHHECEGYSVGETLVNYPGLLPYMPLTWFALEKMQLVHDKQSLDTDPRPALETWILNNVEDGKDGKGDAT